jgi:hypothetical protein
MRWASALSKRTKPSIARAVAFSGSSFSAPSAAACASLAVFAAASASPSISNSAAARAENVANAVKASAFASGASMSQRSAPALSRRSFGRGGRLTGFGFWTTGAGFDAGSSAFGATTGFGAGGGVGAGSSPPRSAKNATTPRTTTPSAAKTITFCFCAGSPPAGAAGAPRPAGAGRRAPPAAGEGRAPPAAGRPPAAAGRAPPAGRGAGPRGAAARVGAASGMVIAAPQAPQSNSVPGAASISRTASQDGQETWAMAACGRRRGRFRSGLAASLTRAGGRRPAGGQPSPRTNRRTASASSPAASIVRPTATKPWPLRTT